MEGSLRASLVGLRCRLADRTPGHLLGVDTLTPALADGLGVQPRLVGDNTDFQERPWDEDLERSRGCLLEAGGQVEDALREGRVPILVAGDCTVSMTTLPVVLRERPDAKVLWLDAHGDYNTPETTPSKFLGGMCLGAACGVWDAGLAEPIDPSRVVLSGVRDLDPPERELLEASPATVVGSSLETLVYTQNALDSAPVYLHIDLDVIDPEDFPALFPAPGGLRPDKLYDLLEAVLAECEVVGAEITAFEAPEDELARRTALSTAVQALGPLMDAVRAKGSHVYD